MSTERPDPATRSRATNFSGRPTRRTRTARPDPEDLLPDRTPNPAEGERQRYALPDEYGPARPTVGNHDDLDHFDDAPAVTVHDRDAEIPAEVVSTPATAAPTAAATDAAPAVTMSRRELREQRQREESAAKSAAKSPPRSRRSKWIRRGVAIAVVVLLIPVAVSYIDYINRPGSDTLSVKTVEFIRDHGGNGVVNTIERWWYTNNPPPTGGKPTAIRVQDTVTDTTVKKNTPPPTFPTLQRLTPPSGRVPTPAPQVEQNEGVWQPTGRLVLGQPAVYTTYVRPDAVHTAYYTCLLYTSPSPRD